MKLALAPNMDTEIVIAIDKELASSYRHGRTFASMHEAYAVLLEEVDELWDLTRLKKKDRDPGKVKEELIQIAAMAVKALESLPRFVGGEV